VFRKVFEVFRKHLRTKIGYSQLLSPNHGLNPEDHQLCSQFSSYKKYILSTILHSIFFTLSKYFCSKKSLGKELPRTQANVMLLSHGSLWLIVSSGVCLILQNDNVLKNCLLHVMRLQNIAYYI